MSRLRDSTGSARSTLAGSGLILLGACIGLVLGALLDAPRILLRRLQEPVQTVEIESTADEASRQAEPLVDEDLSEYRALQKQAPPAARPDVAAPAPAPVAAAPGAATPLPKTREPSAEDVIGEIARRTPREPEPAPKSNAASRSSAAPKRNAAAKAAPRIASRTAVSPDVVQVGAFPDVRSAQRVVDRLKRLGFDSYRSERAGNGGSRHRVRVRPDGVRDAQTLAGSLRERGFDVWITRE
jgi:cell division septation protein DedD